MKCLTETSAAGFRGQTSRSASAVTACLKTPRRSLRGVRPSRCSSAGGGGGLCNLVCRSSPSTWIFSVNTNKGRIKDETTFRDAENVFSCAPGSGMIFLENVSQALFVVTGGERTHPKPIWLSESVAEKKESSFFCSLYREVKCIFQDVYRFTPNRFYLSACQYTCQRGEAPEMKQQEPL